MRVRLTEEFVKGLKFTGKELRIADESQPGFYVRVTSDSRTFVAQASVNGKTRGPKAIGRYEDGMPVEEARRRAMLEIASWRTGANFQLPSAGAATLRTAWTEYQQQPGVKGGRKVERTQSTLESYEYVLNRHTPADWWDKPLSFITKPMVNARHEEIGRDAGNPTANQWLRYVRAIYRRYDENHESANLPKSPCTGVKFFRVLPRKTIVKWEDLPDWWAAVESCSPIRRDCWKMLLLTGLRSNACSELRWEEIDLNAATLTVPAERMKAGEDFTLPLSRYVDLLRQRKADNAKDLGADDRGFVFPTVDRAGKVRAIRDISQQGYNAEGEKIRLLPGPQVLLCANCHRMVHRRRLQCLSMSYAKPSRHRVA